MEKLDLLKALLKEQRPDSWESLPDIDLYMDQVLTYMPRQYVANRKEEQLTSSMINNYIKEGLLSRAKGKKYSKEHLACLTVISMLKQALSVKDTGYLTRKSSGTDGQSGFYASFLEILDKELLEAGELLPDECETELLTQAAMRFAVESYVSKLVCEKLIDLMRGIDGDQPPQKPNKKEKERPSASGE